MKTEKQRKLATICFINRLSAITSRRHHIFNSLLWSRKTQHVLNNLGVLGGINLIAKGENKSFFFVFAAFRMFNRHDSHVGWCWLKIQDWWLNFQVQMVCSMTLSVFIAFWSYFTTFVRVNICQWNDMRLQPYLFSHLFVLSLPFQVYKCFKHYSVCWKPKLQIHQYRWEKKQLL